MEIFVSTFLKMFFIMAPFFVLSVFLTLTSDATKEEKKTLAIKVTIAVIVTSLIILFFGRYIFEIFGITLDSFRIGAGALLFLSAIDLVKGNKDGAKAGDKNLNELAIVPLAIPVVIGPGTIGVLMVMGAGMHNYTQLLYGSSALVCAVLVVGFMLHSSSIIEKIVGKQGLLVIPKITGLFLAALSAQIIFTGIKNFLGL